MRWLSAQFEHWLTNPKRERLAYRMSRWRMSPLYRPLTRRALPILGVVLLAWGLWSHDGLRQFLADQKAQWQENIAERPELMVRVVKVTGAPPRLEMQIRARLNLRLPQSPLDFDLRLIKAQIDQMEEVAASEVSFIQTGVLGIEVTPRVPALIWRSANGLILLDSQGTPAGRIASRSDFPELPLIAGDGADQHTAQAARLIEQLGTLKPRLRGLVYVGERRWDVVLAPEMTIRLPELEPEAALARVLAYHQSRDILLREIRAVDMRNPERPFVRLSHAAVEQIFGSTDNDPAQGVN